ncbi:glutathione S-transferase III [Glonium stellatum]|uniref:glutathione transferase n=1 Tax=Glonium stellatum TaxID=574774 RepID=A0A8E2JNU0_9PEZI|nr:glutathione S-transferase III [Glonium stellatum]
MASFKFHTTPLSFNSLRPELVLAEKGITDFEVVPTDLPTGSHKTPEFMEKSPFGQVPLLEQDDIAIFESRAIARVLATKYSNIQPSLIPDYVSDPKGFALFEQALSIETMKVDPYAGPLIYHKLIGPAMGNTPDEVVIARCSAKLNAHLNVIDGILAKHKYMAGGAYTLADINFMPTFHVLFSTGDGDMITSRPNLARWWADVSGRETWKKTVAPMDRMYAQIQAQMSENGGKMQ